MHLAELLAKFLQALFSILHFTVADLRDLTKVTTALRTFGFQFQLLNVFLGLLNTFNDFFFAFPLGVQTGAFFLQIR